MNPTYHLIVQQFPPLKRKPLMRWLMESSLNKRSHHPAFQGAITTLNPKHRRALLDRRTKIAFSLMREFGMRFAERRVYTTLLHAVEHRLDQRF